LTDVSGNPTVLAAGELIALTENGSGSFADYAGNATTSISDADFTRSGVAWFNVTDTAAETLTITAKGDGDLATTISATTSVVFKQKDIGAGGDLSKAADIAFYGTDGTDGWAGTSISLAAQTATFKATLAALEQDADAAQYTSVVVKDLKGQVQGTSPEAISNGGATASGAYTLAYELAVTVAKGKAYGTFTVPFAAVAAASSNAVDLDSATDLNCIDRAAAVPSAVDLATSAFTSVNGGSYTVEATLLDQFGNGLASYPLSAVATGRNSGAAAINKVTDADGAATFTFTDKGIVSTATSDAIDFYSGGDLDGDTDLTVSYVAVLAGTLTVKADATTLNAIDTDSAKAATVDLVFTALDSNSAPIVGLPITVAGVGTGASVATGSSTIYTGADGTATATVYSSKTGVQSWTGTASLISKSATATRTFVNASTDAKVVALAATDGSVKATVTDNYGNPVKGVTVDFSRSGGVTFGGYASISVKTDASGVAEALVQGSGTVTASLAEADYAKSAWIAGYLGKTSSATASTTAIAGVASASADVTGGSQTQMQSMQLTKQQMQLTQLPMQLTQQQKQQMLQLQQLRMHKQL